MGNTGGAPQTASKVVGPAGCSSLNCDYLRAPASEATRHLGYLCHPAPMGDGVTCSEVDLEGQWTILDCLKNLKGSTAEGTLYKSIREGRIRYCPYTEKFYRNDKWSTNHFKLDLKHVEGGVRNAENFLLSPATVVGSPYAWLMASAKRCQRQ